MLSLLSHPTSLVTALTGEMPLVPCKSGHIMPRGVSPGVTAQCENDDGRLIWEEQVVGVDISRCFAIEGAGVRTALLLTIKGKEDVILQE